LLLVYGTFVFEWVQSCLLTASLFQIIVANYGDLNTVGEVSYTWFSVLVMSAITAFVVQLFYSWRIQRFSGSHILPSIIVALAITQMVGGIVFGAEVRRGTASEITEHIGPISIWLAGGILADFMIAVTMTILIVRRKTTYNTKTDRMMNKIVRLTVETGSATVGMAALDLLLCMIFSDKMYYVSPALVISKMYANSLLANLLNRVFVTKAVQRTGTHVDTLMFARPSHHSQHTTDQPVAASRSVDDIADKATYPAEVENCVSSA